ncbi:MAG TPA: trypsin-like peptidase domain-containing protein [Verrucomicrobiae bacterium]|jgi:TPR repeat protein|nr:trypsin-like peptidase domain-containing protein [Verrucomicrobiae bacterium]
MKAISWALMFSVLLGGTLKAQQPISPTATNALATNSVTQFEGIRANAEKGDALAQCYLGWCYYTGQGVAKDDVEAVKWNRKAAEQNCARAQFDLAFLYFHGEGLKQDYVEAVKWYRKAAQQNDADAQNDLGTCYRHGLGVKKDEVEAMNWYRKAAEQNHAEGQFNLGISYASGQGVAQDDVEAVKWYRKAADQNLADAQYNLGLGYEEGRGVAKDDGAAVKWYRKAADQGAADAQSNLGAMYADGRGVPQDHTEAVRWYRKAADQGNAAAEYNLALHYGDGIGVRQDYAEALKWYRKAADQGAAPAQYNLGAMYGNGDGIPKNYIEAYKWESLAASQGEELAKKYLPVVEMRMTAEQVAEAQRLAAAFVPRNETTSPSFDNSSLPEKSTATGTGFFITNDGYLISNYHVVKDAAQVLLLTSTGLISAKVVRVDSANDLALLKAEGHFAPLSITSSRSVKLGGTVATVGFPDIGLQGFAPKFARGEIASLSGAADDPRYFQISVPVQPGNSGGALVDEHGNVVGVVSAKLDAVAALAATGALPENVNYAVKSSFLLSFLESLPDVSAKLMEPISAERKFDDVVQSAQAAAVLVLVY